MKEPTKGALIAAGLVLSSIIIGAGLHQVVSAFEEVDSYVQSIEVNTMIVNERLQDHQIILEHTTTQLINMAISIDTLHERLRREIEYFTIEQGKEEQ